MTKNCHRRFVHPNTSFFVSIYLIQLLPPTKDFSKNYQRQKCEKVQLKRRKQQHPTRQTICSRQLICYRRRLLLLLLLLLSLLRCHLLRLTAITMTMRILHLSNQVVMITVATIHHHLLRIRLPTTTTSMAVIISITKKHH